MVFTSVKGDMSVHLLPPPAPNTYIKLTRPAGSKRSLTLRSMQRQTPHQQSQSCLGSSAPMATIDVKGVSTRFP